jgi:hypothetical protein
VVGAAQAVQRAAQVALLGRAAHVVLLGQAVCPEPRETQAAKTAVRMFSPLAAQAKTLSIPRGQELGRDPIRAPSINKFGLARRLIDAVGLPWAGQGSFQPVYRLNVVHAAMVPLVA